MKFLSRYLVSNAGFASLLIILIGLLLYTVGFRLDTLPFPHNSPYSDAAISHWPNTLYFQQALRSGQWPLWSDLLMSGQPFSANPLTNVWYPPQSLALLFPTPLHLSLMIWLHLVIAGLGMRVLGQKLGLSAGPASIIGLAYALTPRLFAATGAGHLDILYASAWLPWLLWAIENAFSEQTVMLRQIAPLSAIAALSFLADIRISFFSFAVAASLAGWRLIQASPIERKRALKVLGTSAVLVIGLTAVQWLPLLTLAPYLTRATLSAQDAAAFSLQPLQMIGLAFPDRFGFHETITYAGLAVLVLACIGLVHTPRRLLFWGLIALGAALYALGDQGFLWPVLIRLVPALAWLRVPARAWIVVALALIVLAGFGIQALVASGKDARFAMISGLGLLSMGLAFGIAGSQLPFRQGAAIATLLLLLA